jgi:carbonic anhydrase/acetyltransferase-like protein (isoleucine patch superfamily)
VIPEGMVVPPGSVVMGVPGRIIRPVDAGLTQRIAETWTHYVAQARAHRAGRYPLMPPSTPAVPSAAGSGSGYRPS